uniref:SJCHGC09729 protein n=1 Tax=Schistosoma japonicum TaxID=6182 RepID=Q5BR13_SCHJA|nr:SJCHGC09729 protein [Schistosoma japonicum]
MDRSSCDFFALSRNYHHRQKSIGVRCTELFLRHAIPIFISCGRAISQLNILSKGKALPSSNSNTVGNRTSLSGLKFLL